MQDIDVSFNYLNFMSSGIKIQRGEVTDRNNEIQPPFIEHFLLPLLILYDLILNEKRVPLEKDPSLL